MYIFKLYECLPSQVKATFDRFINKYSVSYESADSVLEIACMPVEDSLDSLDSLNDQKESRLTMELMAAVLVHPTFTDSKQNCPVLKLSNLHYVHLKAVVLSLKGCSRFTKIIIDDLNSVPNAAEQDEFLALLTATGIKVVDYENADEDEDDSAFNKKIQKALRQPRKHSLPSGSSESEDVVEPPAKRQRVVSPTTPNSDNSHEIIDLTTAEDKTEDRNANVQMEDDIQEIAPPIKKTKSKKTVVPKKPSVAATGSTKLPKLPEKGNKDIGSYLSELNVILKKFFGVKTDVLTLGDDPDEEFIIFTADGSNNIKSFIKGKQSQIWKVLHFLQSQGLVVEKLLLENYPLRKLPSLLEGYDLVKPIKKIEIKEFHKSSSNPRANDIAEFCEYFFRISHYLNLKMSIYSQQECILKQINIVFTEWGVSVEKNPDGSFSIKTVPNLSHQSSANSLSPSPSSQTDQQQLSSASSSSSSSTLPSLNPVPVESRIPPEIWDNIPEFSRPIIADSKLQNDEKIALYAFMLAPLEITFEVLQKLCSHMKTTTFPDSINQIVKDSSLVDIEKGFLYSLLKTANYELVWMVLNDLILNWPKNPSVTVVTDPNQSPHSFFSSYPQILLHSNSSSSSSSSPLSAPSQQNSSAPNTSFTRH